MIIWKIAVNEEGTAIPVLDLLPKIPAHSNVTICSKIIFTHCVFEK